MPEKEQSIGNAIVAASNKDFVGFKDAVAPELETQMRDSISAKAQSTREQMFAKVSKTSDADDAIDTDEE